MGGAPDQPLKTTTPPRLKREEFGRTKHDNAFSKWRILVGPTDWEYYESGKEGAERYRISNLPYESSCPGLYEIGVAVFPNGSGRDVSKMEGERIVVVYLGQADNVRSRLQHYGRSGSHLGGGVGFGLFREVFCRGYPIVFRWAPMKSKAEAERTEARLLERFDYAWNKIGNGSRRPNDILMKIEKIASKNHIVPRIFKLLQALGDQKVGIPIKAEKLSVDNKPTHDIYDENSNFNLLGRVLNFSRSKPRLVSENPVTILKESNPSVICGVTSCDGEVCNYPPVQGRKRCAQHKGKRSTYVVKTISYMTNNLDNDDCQEGKFPSNVIDNVVREDFSPICGGTLYDGSPCTTPPLPGRKRCTEHKGMRVKQALPQFPDLKLDLKEPLSKPGSVDCCGVLLGDGKCCMKQPVRGRKRCGEHKGLRVDAYVSKLASREKWFNAVHEEC